MRKKYKLVARKGDNRNICLLKQLSKNEYALLLESMREDYAKEEQNELPKNRDSIRFEVFYTISGKQVDCTCWYH